MRQMDAADFNGYLLKGERIVWWGQPGQGLLLNSQDWLLIPFSLLWGGFAIFWETSVLATNGPIFMKLWSVPFVLIGLYLVAGRFLVDAWIRSQTHYAITDRRVLILRSGPLNKFIAMSIDQLPEATLDERSDGRGTIRFGRTASDRGGRGFLRWTPSIDPTPQLIAIEDARRVFDHVQGIAAAKARATRAIGDAS